MKGEKFLKSNQISAIKTFFIKEEIEKLTFQNTVECTEKFS